ncbi:hypothetical protein LQV63_19700 [Paenibacillus profundus]|uniref:Uncharacterized protein n=1 Tax=Paenibacillus profundus TaxID=1173085 RepID=A0ABS8YHW2_9BACL|nr:hypothetical protein [Paenibacillus profundus]MCE5171530.1 hypothetical protein [Paenibacillus profundus]
MKKVISFSLLFCLSLVLCLPTFANFETPSNVELLERLGYNENDFSLKSLHQNTLRFAQLGFSKEEVKDFTQYDLEYLNELEGQLLALDRKYLKKDENGFIEVNKESYEQAKEEQFRLQSICDTSSQNCSDTEPTSNWMRLTTTVSRISGTNPQEYLIKHDFAWAKKPFYKYKDAVGVAHHVSMTPVQNSEYLKYSRDDYYSRNPIIGLGPWTYDGVSDQYKWSAEDKTGGIGFEFQLASDSAQLINGKQHKYENHRGTVAYRAIRNNSSYTYADLSGHYIHTESSISGALGVDARGTGSFTISANVSKDEAIQTGVSFKY